MVFLKILGIFEDIIVYGMQSEISVAQLDKDGNKILLFFVGSLGKYRFTYHKDVHFVMERLKTF